MIKSAVNPARLRLCAAALFAFSVFISVTAVEAALILLAFSLFAGSPDGLKPRIILAKAAAQPLFRPWMFYLAAGVLASVFALKKGEAFSYLPSDLIKYLCFAVLLSAVKEDLFAAVSEFYTAGAVFAAAAGISQVGWFYGSYGTFYQRAGAFANPVRYGEIMVIAFTFVLATVLRPPQGDTSRRPKYRMAAAALIFLAALLSRTRGAYLGLLTVPFTLILADRRLRRPALAAAGAFFLLAAGLAALDPHFRGRLVYPYTRSDASVIAAEKAVTTGNRNFVAVNIRRELWQTGYRMFRAHPAFGIGPSNVRSSFRSYHDGPLGPQETWGSLHSLYINQLAERGLVGLAALLALFLGMAGLALRNYRLAPGPYTLWAVAVLPAYFVMNLTEVSFQHVHTSFAVFLALALSANSAAAKPGTAGTEK